MTTRQDRLELLAGLLDTDGSLLCGGYDFIQKEKQIADAVVFLCRSLGLAAYVSNQLKGIASTGFEAFYWRVSISGDCSIIPCRDPKKRAPARMQKKNHLVTGLRIKSVGIGPYVGFEIDGDRQFLLGDWQVTHNTILALNYIQQALKKGKRAMFVCDRKTLIAQTSNVAREVGLGYHGIIQANNPMMDLSRPFQIASAQTLMRRGWPQNMDVIVVDEVHSQYKTWVDYVTSDECKAHVLGLSATPFSTGLGRIFTNLINAATMHDLVNLGILVPMRIFSCRKPNMEGAETSGGEWTDKAAEERELVIVGDVVREWTRFAENRKTIVFGATILHCEEMARQFNEAGIPAATFCADTPDDERARILREFEYGNIRILISVEALAKGFDCKDLSCVCDCRPLRKSLSTFIQMVGRGARSSPETGKKDFLLLDFSGNIIRFADDFSRIYFNGLDRLDDGEKLDKEIRKDEEKPIKACPKCGYKPMGKRCVGCGYEPEPKALIEQLPGEMTEIKLKNGKVLAADKVELFCQLSTYVKSSSIADPEKREKRVMALYKAIANEWPPREMKAATAPEVQPNRATVNKIKSIYTAWAHRKAS
jgi:superfamily II DNA or RNA helicase